MNEEPKSIWKKSWKGWRGLLLWMASLTLFVFVLVMVIQWLLPGRTQFSELLRIALMVSLLVGVLAVLAVALIRWQRSWRNFKRFLFGLACFVTLVALFYAEENWRGKHVWEKYKQEWEAKGERFDLAGFVPSTVPDDQNFALTPIVASSYLNLLDKSGHRITPPDTNIINRLEMTVRLYDAPLTNGMGNWQKTTGSDLTVWQQYYRELSATTNLFPVAPQPQSPAADVLLALSRYDSAIEELRQAGRLPASRFPLNYDDANPSAILLPHLTALRRCSQMLQLRAIAELQNNQSDKALEDIGLVLRLTDSIHTEPILISHLVRIAMGKIALQPVWEGLAEHKWSEEQLASLDSELAKLNFVADYGFAMRSEQACLVGVIDYLRRKHKNYPCNDSTEWDIRIPGAFPAGWYYQTQLRYCRFFTRWYLPLADASRGVFAPASVRNADAALDAELKQVSPYRWLEAMLLPALGNAAKKFANGQESVDLARVAIALERYRLAHGEFPESLATLTPQFIAKLPRDVINGQPLHYRRDPPSPGSGAASRLFVLYSVGWNETDDGGEVGLNKSGAVDINTGDWVWRYPAK
jgi:hypothetical protein